MGFSHILILPASYPCPLNASLAMTEGAGVWFLRRLFVLCPADTVCYSVANATFATW